MGDGHVGQWRFHPGRRLSAKEEALYWQQMYVQMKSERDFMDKQNQKLAIRVVELERVFLEFRTAQVGNDRQQR